MTKERKTEKERKEKNEMDMVGTMVLVGCRTVGPD